MTIKKLENLWSNAFKETINLVIPKKIIETLALQTLDSIKRIQIYESYRERAQNADNDSLSYYHTYIPFILTQRKTISLENKIWFLYLATYFGKSRKSKWDLFRRASFDSNNELLSVEGILSNRKNYFDYLKSIDFFKDADFSNHRKFIAKRLEGNKGFINSSNYVLDNLSKFLFTSFVSFDEVYCRSHKIPNFGRMAAFDFTSSLCKCELKVKEPESMYLKNSTGPLVGLGYFLKMANGKNITKANKVKFGNELLEWFLKNSDIFMVAQVLEDSICNWQKSPKSYMRYFG